MQTIISGHQASMTIQPFDIYGNTMPGFRPLASTFAIQDNNGHSYTINGIAWNNDSGTANISFSAPVWSGSLTLCTFSISYNASPLVVLGTSQFYLSPGFKGKSITNGANLVWDLAVSGTTQTALSDYSGNNNYACRADLGSFLTPYLTTTTTFYPSLSSLSPFALGRAPFSLKYPYPWGLPNSANYPTLNAASLATTYSQGIPFQSVSTVFIVYDSSGADTIGIWTMRFTDASGSARGLRLSYFGLGSSSTTPNLKLESWVGGTWVSVWIFACSPYLTRGSGASPNIGLITVVLSNGGATIYGDNNVIGAISNCWGSSPPSITGTSQITYFAGMGDYATLNSSGTFASIYGQAELIGYSQSLNSTQVALNAHAWGLS